MPFRPQDNRVEEGNNDDGSRHCGVPLIADGAFDSQSMFEGKIDNSDQHDVETDDDEGSDGDVGHYRISESIKDLTAI